MNETALPPHGALAGDAAAALAPSDTSVAESSPEHMLSATQAAALFGRSVRSLHNWERTGVLLPVRVRGRRFYAWAAIEALMRGGDGQRRAREGSPVKYF